MKAISALFIAIILLVSTHGFASAPQLTMTKEQAIRDLHTFMTLLRTHYGMAKFKEKTFGQTLDEAEKEFTAHINEGTSLEGFRISDATDSDKISLMEVQQLFIGLAAKFLDGHTNIKRNSTDGWTVGLKTADIGGHLIVVGIDEQYFNGKNLTDALDIGDEVVEVNGQPVEELANQIMIYAQIATFDARRMWALEHILEVPSSFLRPRNNNEQVRVTFKRELPDGSTKKITGFFNWTNIADFNRLRTGYEKYIKPLKAPPYYFGNTGTTESYLHIGINTLIANGYLTKDSVLDIGRLVNMEIKDEATLYKTFKGNTKTSDGQIIEKSADADFLKPISRLQVYSVNFSGLRIGVIRIPNYSPEGGFGEVLSELAFLRRAISKLNEHTDTVIIDQVSNNGGYVDYVTQLVKLFAAGQEIPSMTQDIRLSQTYINTMAQAQNLKNAQEESDNLVNDHPELPNLAQISISKFLLEKLETKLKNGEGWSGPMPFMTTVDNVNEGEPGAIVSGGDVTYKGKVLIVNDRRSASGGDFFPEISQASGRAPVMGSTSRGLGGPVYLSWDSIGGVEMYMRCTFAYCENSKGLFFENVGVVPDVPRDVEVSDLKTGFGYFALDVLNVARAQALGVPVKQINEQLHSELLQPVRVSDSTKNLDDKINEVIKVAKKGNLDETIKVYEELKEYLAANQKNIPADEWRRIQIPLPKALTGEDLILSSVKDREAVLERLTQMAKLPKYQNDANLKKLNLMVHQIINESPKEAGVLTPCAFRLKNIRAAAQTKK